MAKKLTEEQKAENKKLAAEKRELAKAERSRQKELTMIESWKNQPRVKRMEISIEWKKSRTWGSNPFLYARVWTEKGFQTFEATCSGCGYDKESEVISKVFNEFLKYKLFIVQADVEKCGERINGKQEGKPYGVHLAKAEMDHPYYDGGIGTSCYYAIAEFIGGKFTHVGSGKTSDSYTYEDDGTIK